MNPCSILSWSQEPNAPQRVRNHILNNLYTERGIANSDYATYDRLGKHVREHVDAMFWTWTLHSLACFASRQHESKTMGKTSVLVFSAPVWSMGRPIILLLGERVGEGMHGRRLHSSIYKCSFRGL
jgi:hypothetical protein